MNHSRITRTVRVIGISIIAALVLRTAAAAAAPVTTHPRLWLRQTDLTRLRSWAVASNPIWNQGLKPLAVAYRGYMDDGSLLAGDAGANWGYTMHPVEWAAELFAFMSLVDPDATARDNWGARARTLLMHIMDRAVLGPTAADSNWRWTGFSTNMRSLFYGESFPLAVDWIYPRLTSADKATIRTVFLRWQAENLVATTSGRDHPDPPWLLDDPLLIAVREQYRWAGNNFFIAHMNQIGLMSLALDAADDPGSAAVNGDQVRDYLADAIGAWLYMHDKFSEKFGAGGVPAEGLMYGPTGIGRAGEFLLALQTAGQDDAAVWGPQVSFTTPFWQAIVPALLHTASPTPTVLEHWVGPVYQVADHGDAYEIYAKSAMTLLGTMGLHAQYTGDAQRLNDARWLETNLAPGGAAMLVDRSGDWNYVRDCILHFMLFDPAASALSDPRPALPTSLYAAGIGRLLARTAWDDPQGIWFTHLLGWASIDHQHAAGNMIELWRKGEWITKQWSGYGMYVGTSDYKNTLTVQNNPWSGGIDFWVLNNARGSQYIYGPGDGALLAKSLAGGYTYALGDATTLYNNARIGASAVTEATRSVLWIKPDTIVLYDRAATTSAGFFKRFWLNAPSTPIIDGRRATAATASGNQMLVVDSLLPAAATLSIDTAIPDGAGYVETANYEPMVARLRIEATGAPARTAFLTVVSGADAGVTTPAGVAITSLSGTPFAGAVIGAAAVLFPVSLGADRSLVPSSGAPFAGMRYQVPSTVQVHYITGLKPGAHYTARGCALGAITEVEVLAGGDLVADAGGVLVIGGSAAALPDALNRAPGGPTDFTQETPVNAIFAVSSPLTDAVGETPVIAPGVHDVTAAHLAAPLSVQGR